MKQTLARSRLAAGTGQPSKDSIKFNEEVNTMSRGKQFPDIIWYCDNCGERLDLQPYFSDRRGTWRCKSCGYKNEISAENIDWDDDDEDDEDDEY